MNISFSSPWFLIISVILCAIVLGGYFFVDKKNRKQPKNIISLCIHLLIAILIGLSSSNMSYLKTSDKTDLYVLVDASYSNEQNYDLMDNYINQISSLIDSGTRMGVITYGKNFELLTPSGGRIKSIKNTRIDRSATDLEGALRYTNGLFKSENVKRIIIISDSSETDNSALNTLDDLIKNNVYIDAIYLDNPLVGDEVQINQLYYSNSVYLHQENKLKVSIQSSVSTDCEIKLYKDNTIFNSLNISLTRGINIVNFDLDNENVGSYQYKVHIDAKKDNLVDNNEMCFLQEVTSKIKVLLLSESTTDYLEINKLYSSLYNEDYELDSYIGSNNDHSIENVPTSLMELCKYDEIVLSNVNIVQINNSQEFVDSLEQFVSYYGKSLLTFGATYANGTNTDYLDKYNSMLPVQFEQSDAKALALVVDCSYSMEDSKENSRLDMAKEGAKACLDLLGEKDYVSIVSFSDDAKVVQPLTSISNKEEIIKAIDTIKVTGSTNMNTGLSAAYSQLRSTSFDDKQVLFLTDGLPSDKQSDIERTVYNMAKDNITTSFINIACKEGEDFLKDLIKISGGTYYYVSQSTDLVKIILTSVADKVSNTKIEGEFEVNINEKNNSLLNNITSFEKINGYNYSKIRTSADTLLTVTYTNEQGGTREVPLYAYWSYGKGKVSSFTSNIGNSWTKEFRKSDNGKQFLENTISNCLPSERINSVFNVDVSNNGFTSNINVSLALNKIDGFLKMKVTSPTGKEEERYLKYNSSAYQGVFTSDEIGLYKMNITYTSNEIVIEDEQYFYFSYSKEYNKFLTKDESLLYKLTENRGQVSKEVNYIINNEEINNRSEQSLSLWLLVVSIILFIVDIAIRKIRFKNN